MSHYNSIKIASIFGIIGNLFLLIIKGTIGFLTKSQAMIADATNSFGDIFSSIATFIGNKIASKPQDEDHNLGHGKAEYMFSMFISIGMILMGALIFKNSITTLFSNEYYKFSIWIIITCLITIFVKFLLFIYTDKLAKKYNNILLEANSKDHRNDCIVTLSNLISCIFSLLNIYWLDAVVGSAISFWMIIGAIKIFKESYDVLMDKAISCETKEEVMKIIASHSEIKKITHFNSTPIGYKFQISFTIFVDGNLSTFESHKIADNLEKEINEKIEKIYLSVIHVNPI